jgi:CheY-like chemotaxis protein
LREGKEAVRGERPDLIISDLDLPDGLGIELATEVDRLGMQIPIVFVSAYVGKFRHRMPAQGDFEVYEKPLALEQLRAVVEEKLSLRVDAGMSPFGVADYVQLAAMGRHSVLIDVASAVGRGEILIKRGEVWSAKDRLGRGLEAFRRLAFLGTAQVTCRSFDPQKAPPRDIEGSAESVLLDAARNHDEAERESSAGIDDGWSDVWGEDRGTVRPEATGNRAPSVRPPSIRPIGLSPPVADRFGDAFDRGVDALLAKDYSTARAAFVEANEIAPNDRRVLANLARLREMGFS